MTILKTKKLRLLEEKNDGISSQLKWTPCEMYHNSDMEIDQSPPTRVTGQVLCPQKRSVVITASTTR